MSQIKLRILRWPAHQQTTSERQKPWHWWQFFVSFLHQPVVWLVAATSLGTSCREGKIGHIWSPFLSPQSQARSLPPDLLQKEEDREHTYAQHTQTHRLALCIPRKRSHDMFPNWLPPGTSMPPWAGCSFITSVGTFFIGVPLRSCSYSDAKRN